MTDTQPTPVSAEALATWLQPRLPNATKVTVTDFSQPKSGYSATTLMFDADVTGPGHERAQKFVLRMETPEGPVYPVQVPGTEIEISVQYRVMEALASSCAAPFAPLYGFEEDPSVLGAPFFVMGFIGGEVPVEDPPYTMQGFFVDATPEQRRAMVLRGIDVMAAVHATDWEGAGLSWLNPADRDPGTERQMDLWQTLGEHELGDRVHPNLDIAWNWLRANLPSDERLTVNWGDARLGNVIWQDFEPVALTDFEASSIGPPELDVGWWLMFHRWSHEAMGNPNYLDGEPTRSEQIAHYEKASGRPAANLDFHEFFACARYAVIVVRVMNRLVERQIMPADQDIWLNNPSADLLATMIDEMGLS